MLVSYIFMSMIARYSAVVGLFFGSGELYQLSMLLNYCL